jgi:hypothetical protein
MPEFCFEGTASWKSGERRKAHSIYEKAEKICPLR